MDLLPRRCMYRDASPSVNKRTPQKQVHKVSERQFLVVRVFLFRKELTTTLTLSIATKLKKKKEKFEEIRRTTVRVVVVVIPVVVGTWLCIITPRNYVRGTLSSCLPLRLLLPIQRQQTKQLRASLPRFDWRRCRQVSFFPFKELLLEHV